MTLSRTRLPVGDAGKAAGGLAVGTPGRVSRHSESDSAVSRHPTISGGWILI